MHLLDSQDGGKGTVKTELVLKIFQHPKEFEQIPYSLISATKF